MRIVLSMALLTMALAGIAAANDVPVAAPEISASTAISAFGLLGGALLVMRARRKK